MMTEIDMKQSLWKGFRLTANTVIPMVGWRGAYYMLTVVLSIGLN